MFLALCVLLPRGTAAQQAEDPCQELKTPQLIKEHYFERAKYKDTFPCMARLIKAGGYRASAAVLKDQIFPVIDHYFANNLDVEGGYKLGELLWRIMIGTNDETAAQAVQAFDWSKEIKPAVSKELNRFNNPAAIKIEPAKATVKRRQNTKFTVMYLNVANIPLTSVTPSIRTTVNPGDKATAAVQGDKIIVTGLTGGEKAGNLVVRDAKRNLGAEAQLMFSGGMSLLWPISGLVIAGGAAGGAAVTEEGTSTALWAVSGVSAVATGYLFYKYFRGEGVPFFSKSDADRSSEDLAVRLVPGPRSLEFQMRF